MGSKSKQSHVKLYVYRKLEKQYTILRDDNEFLKLLLEAEKKKLEILKLVRPRQTWGKIKCFLGRHNLEDFADTKDAFKIKKICKQCGNVYVEL